VKPIGSASRTSVRPDPAADHEFERWVRDLFEGLD